MTDKGTLQDGFLYALRAYLQNGGVAQVAAAPANCCPGRITDGPAGCTCWAPEYDLDQSQPDPATVASLGLGQTEPIERSRMCGDCAYRPNSPEKRGDESQAFNADGLDDLAMSGQRFYCHDGMPTPVAWRHPAGMRIPADPTRHGDYQPLIIMGVPYQADGQPGLLCAGWSARRRALTARNSTP